MPSMLRALEEGSVGGDTAWANMYEVHTTLSCETRELIDRLKAVHVRDRRRNPRAEMSKEFDRDANAYTK